MHITPSTVLPVIFIHGLIGPFAPPTVLTQVTPTPLVPDLLGYGRFAAVPADTISIDAQVDHLRLFVDLKCDGPVHLVAHSTGAVVASAYAHAYPQRVASLVNIEGNFAPEDATLSRRLAAMSVDAISREMTAALAQPLPWLEQIDIPAELARVGMASDLLSFQPASTLQAMGRAVVDYTADHTYTDMLRDVVTTIPVHLVAGGRSRHAWHVPDWALAEAASYTEVPGCGHMLTIEAPTALGAVLRFLR